MKEDILEQMVDDWLISQQATFTKHNIKYKPQKTDLNFNSRSDAVHSDIDILSIHLNKSEEEYVRAISCKSYQGGFNIEHWYNLLTRDAKEGKDKSIGGRPAWKHHRELCIPKWGKALAGKVYDETNSKDFTWTIVVTKLVGKNIDYWKNKFVNESAFKNNLKYNPTSKIKIEVKTVSDIVNEYWDRSFSDTDKSKSTLETSQFGRLLQVLKAANIHFKSYE